MRGAETLWINSLETGFAPEAADHESMLEGTLYPNLRRARIVAKLLGGSFELREGADNLALSHRRMHKALDKAMRHGRQVSLEELKELKLDVQEASHEFLALAQADLENPEPQAAPLILSRRG